jgi:hypothetical protein
MRAILMSNQRRLDRGNPRGSVLVEAALVISLVFVPLALGVATVGLNIIRAMQANQINRDAGHMFARATDLSGTASGLVNRGILFQMAPALQTTTSSGTAVLILTWVKYLNSAASCPDPCPNRFHVVILQRIVLGNAALKASAFGTVPAGSMDATTGKVTNPTTDTTVRADGVLSYLTMVDKDESYVSETYFSSADLAVPGFPSPAGTYARAFF